MYHRAHLATNTANNQLASRNTTGTHVPWLATKFCKLREVGSIPTVSIWFFRHAKTASRQSRSCCGVAELVQRPAVNGKITGSKPVATAIADMKRIGKQPVLKTGALKGVAGSSPCHVRHFFCPKFWTGSNRSLHEDKSSPCNTVANATVHPEMVTRAGAKHEQTIVVHCDVHHNNFER